MTDRGNIIPFPGPGRAGAALRVRVDLLLMPSPVWRRILVPADCSFWDLHVAIQDAFAWEDRHLHQQGSPDFHGLRHEAGAVHTDPARPLATAGTAYSSPSTTHHSRQACTAFARVSASSVGS